MTHVSKGPSGLTRDGKGEDAACRSGGGGGQLGPGWAVLLPWPFPDLLLQLMPRVWGSQDGGPPRGSVCSGRSAGTSARVPGSLRPGATLLDSLALEVGPPVLEPRTSCPPPTPTPPPERLTSGGKGPRKQGHLGLSALQARRPRSPEARGPQNPPRPIEAPLATAEGGTRAGRARCPLTRRGVRGGRGGPAGLGAQRRPQPEQEHGQGEGCPPAWACSPRPSGLHGWAPTRGQLGNRLQGIRGRVGGRPCARGGRCGGAGQVQEGNPPGEPAD